MPEPLTTAPPITPATRPPYPDTRRAAHLLGLSWAVSWIGVPVSGAFGSVIVLQLTGDPRLTGVPFFLLYVGTLVAAYPAGLLMDRFGRRPVLIGGHLVAAFGFTLGTVAIIAGNLWLFLGGHLVAAFGASTTYLTRLAAADLYPAHQRARGLGRLVFYLVFGALGSVPLTWFAQSLQGTVGQSDLAIAWGLIPILSLIAATLVGRIHPDPKETAQEIQRLEAVPLPVADVRRAPWRLMLAGGAALVFAQAAMVSLMSVAGASLEQHGHSHNFIVGTLTAHIFGMFAFSPVIGVLGDRWGRRPLLWASGVYLVVATAVPTLVPIGDALTVALFAVGIGWSFSFLAATAIIADATGASRRGRVTGILDVAVALMGGAASLMAGAALDQGGIERVSGLALMFSLGVVIAAALVPGFPTPRPKTPISPVPDNVGK